MTVKSKLLFTLLAAAVAVPTLAEAATPAIAQRNLAAYIFADDYPASARRAGEEGEVAFRLVIGAEGRVDACTITRSSGSSALDSTTCRIMRSRARFTPARDAAGNRVADSMESTV